MSFIRPDTVTENTSHYWLPPLSHKLQALYLCQKQLCRLTGRVLEKEVAINQSRTFTFRVKIPLRLSTFYFLWWLIKVANSQIQEELLSIQPQHRVTTLHIKARRCRELFLRNIKFHTHVTQNVLRPIIILVSRVTKQLI